MTDDELKQLVAANATGIAEIRRIVEANALAIAELKVIDQNQAARMDRICDILDADMKLYNSNQDTKTQSGW